MKNFPVDPLGKLSIIENRHSTGRKRGPDDALMLFDCIDCGAMVPRSARNKHIKFHEELAIAIHAGKIVEKIRANA